MSELVKRLIETAMTLEREQGAAAGCDEGHPAWVDLEAAESSLLGALNALEAENARLRSLLTEAKDADDGYTLGSGLIERIDAALKDHP